MSSSSGTPESWISSFCSLLGHEYFAEVSEDFIEDDFNLTGLQTQVAMYKEALEMILDVEPLDDNEDDDDDDDDVAEGSMEAIIHREERLRHYRTASDLSTIESSAEMLYGLIHQRFICSRAGIQQMSEKYELTHFGCCPRTNCEGTRTLPVGLSDTPGEDTVKLFCPSCLDVYVPPNSRFQTVDGAFFGRTFGVLFMLTFPDLDLTKRGYETLTSLHTRASNTSTNHDSAEKEKINGLNANNLASGLGKGKMYEPRIYGFRVSERARSGPRMSWLRDRPSNIQELNEAAAWNMEHADESEDEVDMEDVTTWAPSAQRRNKNQQVSRGSPMSVEATKSKQNA
ncbi:BgTH12-02966 [Blumeria graminis f. sp. triticale]|uniref:Casein kinase II subunit beta n=3 Tax=Blumeria graminis TaxID=34373 RepID=A0A061HGU9_BLUGR|nr:Beta regulatory subunit of casein kinase [Blumeria graminis f. sp. tritici 96224]CAD6503299.1 BgTH12-02966 [Blumeria graminis f. sp. triticale]VDB89300.1 Bgt-245 [Blumeria graminis f. sp. tritici]